MSKNPSIVHKVKADHVIVDLMLVLTIAQVHAYCPITGCGTIWMATMLHHGKWPTCSINDLSWISSSWLIVIQIIQCDVLAFWLLLVLRHFDVVACLQSWE